MEMIETLFSVEIKASKETVWRTLWEEASFKIWANIIDEGTVMKGELVEGQCVEFISTVNGYGVTSLIAELKPHEYVLFHHGADTQDMGTALREQEWTNGKESYELKQVGEKTLLIVRTDIPVDLVDIFKERLPQALDKIKELSENESRSR